MKFKFPKITEYDIILLALIVWLTAFLYPSFNTTAELNVSAICTFIPASVLCPIIYYLAHKKFNSFMKIFFAVTSWFLIVLATMLITAFVATRGYSASHIYPASLVQPLLGAELLVTMLYSIKKPKLRWYNFFYLVVFWAFAMPKSFGTSWAAFKPSEFFFGDFLTFVVPAILYLHLVEVRKSETRISTHIRKQIKAYKVRFLRLGHFGIYILFIAAAMFLTLDMVFLKFFSSSSYLIISVELASPVTWLLFGVITVGMLMLIPTVIAILVRRRNRRKEFDF